MGRDSCFFLLEMGGDRYTRGSGCTRYTGY